MMWSLVKARSNLEETLRLVLWGLLVLLLLPVAVSAQEEDPAAEESGGEVSDDAADEPFVEDEGGLGEDGLGEDGLGEDGLGEDGLGEEEGSLGTTETDLEAIENLLAQDESTRSDAEAFGYDAESRRDPFRSLLQGRDAPGPATDRPEGIAGLLIDEILVEGVFELADGPVAQVQASHEDTSYLLRPGDQLWDGDVVSISLEEVVFKQVVEDPTALKPFREVVKRLNP